MSYRRPGKEIHDRTVTWQQWLSDNEDLIRRSGVPSFVLRTEEDWWYFVRNTYYRPFRHGDNEQFPWFEIDQLDPANKQTLWDLIIAAISAFHPDHQSQHPHWLSLLAQTYGPPNSIPE